MPRSRDIYTLTLKAVYAIATGERQNRTQDPDTIDIGEGECYDTTHIDVRAIDEAQDILEVILECVRSLLRLSILIRKATLRDRWDRALQKQQDDRLDDSFDIRHVGEKFPKLDRPENEWLKIRLGRAITQRRQFIRYCRKHKDQLSGHGNYGQALGALNIVHYQAIESNFRNDVPAASTANRALTLPKTEASTKASTLQVATLEATRDDPDDDVASIVSSVVSSVNAIDHDDDKLRLPTLQTVSNGRDEFECPLCFTVRSFKNPWKWKKHAYADLKPYVCSGGRGQCDLEVFPDQDAWFTHELENHRQNWICRLCEQNPFDSEARFRAHVRSKHEEIPASHISDFTSLCKRPPQHLPAKDCPFCDDFESKLREAEAERDRTNTQDAEVILVPVSNFRRHVASHMEQLALFALGTSVTSDEPSESGSDASRVQRSARDADIMKLYLKNQEEFESDSFRGIPLDRPLPSCPRSELSSEYNDWYTLNGCSNFDICPSCFEGVFADTPFSTYFSPVARAEEDGARYCDFSSPWMRLAWLLTIKQRRKTPEFLYQLDSILETEGSCPGDYELSTDQMVWYGIPDERDGGHVANFVVCGCDLKSLEALIPSFRGYFTPVQSKNPNAVPSTFTCSFRACSRRFPRYLDLLLELDGEAQHFGLQPSTSRFIKMVRENASRNECSRDKPLRDKLWHFIPHLPEFTVCQECFDELILPAITSASSHIPDTIPKLFNRTMCLVPDEDPELGSTCCLYSPRMRKIWERSVENEDFEYLKRKAIERKQVEKKLARENSDILTLIAELKSETVQWEKENARLNKNNEEWKTWE